MKHLPFTLVALGMIFSMIPMAGYAEEDSTQITRDGLTYEIVSSSILCICSFVSLKFRSQCTAWDKLIGCFAEILKNTSQIQEIHRLYD